MPRLKRVIIFIQVVCVLPVLCFSQTDVSKKKGPAFFGLPLTFEFGDLSQDQRQTIQNQCLLELEKIEHQFSAHRQGSEINAINQFAGQRPIVVSQIVIDAMQWTQSLWEKSAKRYDVTTASFKWHYGFGQGDYRVPTFIQLDSAKSLVGHELIIIDKEDKKILFKRDGVQVDLQDVIVGLGLVRLHNLLKKNKVRYGKIQVGQNVMIAGKKTAHKSLHHTVIKPWTQTEPLLKVTLKKGMLLMDEIYSESFIEDEKRYHNHLDPQTGHPFRHSVLAICIYEKPKEFIMPPALLLTMKPEEAIAFINKQPHIECYLLDKTNKAWMSKKWKSVSAMEMP